MSGARASRRRAAGRPARSAAALAAVALLSAGGLACGGAGPDPGSGDADPVRVAVAPFLRYAPFHHAEATGGFRAAGVEVELVEIPRNREILAALLEREIDVAPMLLGAGVFNAIARGAPVRIVADRGSAELRSASEAFILRSALVDDRGRLVPASPAGLRISVRTATYEEYLLDRLAAVHGLGPGVIEAAHLPSSAELAALSTGAIDGLFTSEPNLSAISATGEGRVWTPIGELATGLSTALVLYGPRLVEEDREAGVRFMTAYLAAVRELAEPTPATVRRISEWMGVDLAALSGLRWPTIRADGRIDPAGVREFQLWAREQGLLDRVVEPEAYWDGDFVEHAAARLERGPG